jgi:GNAT superfamily N-acetyltransferase
VVGLVCFGQAHELTGPIPGRAHVAACFTHPDRWREGIAGSLLAVAEQRMRDDGYREVQLWTPRDAPARGFYEATGWRHDGREQWLDELALPLVAYVKPL